MFSLLHLKCGSKTVSPDLLWLFFSSSSVLLCVTLNRVVRGRFLTEFWKQQPEEWEHAWEKIKQKSLRWPLCQVVCEALDSFPLCVVSEGCGMASLKCWKERRDDSELSISENVPQDLRWNKDILRWTQTMSRCWPQTCFKKNNR